MDELKRWQQRLNHSCHESAWSVVHVVEHARSTQDALRERTEKPGSIFAALRQTSGRGQYGRAWADTEEDGLAMSFSLPRETSENAWRLATLAALSAADAIESRLSKEDGSSIQIKWPNDLFLHSKKVGGILIEQADSIAIVGIGINVSQTSWPADLADSAISLKQAGFIIDRLDLAAALLESLGRWQDADEAELQAAFARRNLLIGRDVVVGCCNDQFEGRCSAIDPARHLEIETDQGTQQLPIATCRIIAASGLSIQS